MGSRALPCAASSPARPPSLRGWPTLTPPPPAPRLRSPPLVQPCAGEERRDRLVEDGRAAAVQGLRGQERRAAHGLLLGARHAERAAAAGAAGQEPAQPAAARGRVRHLRLRHPVRRRRRRAPNPHRQHERGAGGGQQARRAARGLPRPRRPLRADQGRVQDPLCALLALLPRARRPAPARPGS